MKAKFIALAALVLGLASCQQDFDAPVQMGSEVDFQLSVAATELAGTRAGENGQPDEQNAYDSAYGAIDYLQGGNGVDALRVDWTEVDLRYSLEVYDVADDYTNAVPVKDRLVKIVDSYEPVTFDLRLVPNREYRFVVFADFVPNGASEDANVVYQSTLGLRHNIGDNLGQITIKDDAINDEIADAYFYSDKIEITNSASKDIVLERPYGKVRVIATDLAELNLNVNPKAVKVVYTAKHPQTFNAVTGAISAEYSTVEYKYVYGEISKESLANHVYTADYDAKTATNANGDVRHTHMTLFTDYILAADQTPYHFTMSVYEDDKFEQPIKETVFNTDIPVERNMLTTVIGNVLTTATDITVTIDDNFAGYHNRKVVYVSDVNELQEAIDACEKGTTIIFFEDNIIGDVIIKQQEGINIVLNGHNFNYDGKITINGDARYDGKETLKIENINFKSDAAKTFIEAPTKFDGKYNYSHNITVQGCTFSSETFNEKIVGIKLQTTYNAVVKNCKAENIHTLAQFYSTDNKTIIENVEVVNCKNGIALGNIAEAVINGAKIKSLGYGIRLDGEKTRTVAATIDNAEIEAYIPVTIRYMNDEACNVDVEFIGTNNKLKGEVYEIAFCSNEYEKDVDPQNPVGTFRLQNAEEARAFYGTVTSFSAFDAAVNSTNNPVVKVESAIKKVGLGVEVERDVEIDFQGNEFNAGSNASSYWYAIEAYGEYDICIKNANFTRAGVFAGEGANVVFENGVINHKPERSSRYIFCAKSGATITVKDGTFTNDREKNTYFYADAATIIVEGGVFNGVKSKSDRVCGKTDNGGKIIIKGGTFNFDPTAWLAEGYTATKSGSTWTVSAL